MNSGDIAPVLVTTVLTLAVTIVLILRGPVGRALSRRIEGASGQAFPDIEQLQGRVAELEQQVDRMHELEERLDFTERLLAQQRDEPARIGKQP